MLLAFIDETGDKKRKDYLGLSVAVVNGLHYPQVKQKAQTVLTSGGWASDVEFKGAHLFSSKKGCPDVRNHRHDRTIRPSPAPGGRREANGRHHCGHPTCHPTDWTNRAGKVGGSGATGWLARIRSDG